MLKWIKLGLRIVEVKRGFRPYNVNDIPSVLHWPELLNRQCIAWEKYCCALMNRYYLFKHRKTTQTLKPILQNRWLPLVLMHDGYRYWCERWLYCFFPPLFSRSIFPRLTTVWLRQHTPFCSPQCHSGQCDCPQWNLYSASLCSLVTCEPHHTC